MGALVALTLWSTLSVAAPDPPVLVEVLRSPVPSGVRHVIADQFGRWYLVDAEHHTVLLKSVDERMERSVGGYGWSLSGLDRPSGIATDGVRVYVADEGNHRIVEYDRELRPLTAFSTRDTSVIEARFGYPRGVALSSRGDLVILDGESEDVVSFGTGGRLLFRAGREVPGGTPLRSPSCIGMDDSQRILVGEEGGARMLDLFGNQVGAWSFSPGVRPRGIAGRGSWTACVIADTLFLIDGRSSEVSRWSRAALVPDLPTGQFWDVAWMAGTLLVLTEGELLGFRIES